MRSRLVWISIGLAIITLAAYWPVRNFGFVSYDDYQYVYDNPHIKSGLTWANNCYAFTTFDTKNYHPLTWVSYLTDATLFGARPQGMHIENVLIHLLNVILLLLFMVKATNRLWPSTIVAALFAVHPVHVESVAWISERKDVLSMLCFLLALLSYISFARLHRRQNRATAYIATLVLFACGLLFKSMLVTFPFLLLLIDWWPLCRIGVIPPLPRYSHATLVRALIEKIPFFILSIAASILTSRAQHDISASLQTISLTLRAENAVLSYVGYLAESFWPIDLSVLYPYRWEMPPQKVILDMGLLVILTVWFVVIWHHRQYAVVGWLWFLGTLVPVIGVVQVGAQSMADRYLYLPSIGLSILVVWSLCPTARVVGHGVVAVVTLAVVIALAFLTRHQVGYWVDSDHLFGHASIVLNGQAGDEIRLGVNAKKIGDDAAAERHFRLALEEDPHNYAADFNLGNLLLDTNPALAIEHYQAAATKQPRQAEIQINWGVALLKLNDRAGAFSHFQLAEALDPDSYDAHYNLARLFLIANKLPQARAEFTLALRTRPDDPWAKDGLRAAQP